MKHAILLLMILFAAGTAQTQSNTLSGGGQASGSGGTASYSIGQVVYSSNLGPNGSADQGVEQPYEISTITSTRRIDIALSAQVYPNPAAEYLTLLIDGGEVRNLSYALLDVQGRVLSEASITGDNTLIPVSRFPAGVYFLKIFSRHSVLSTFKILKNK